MYEHAYVSTVHTDSREVPIIDTRVLRNCLQAYDGDVLIFLDPGINDWFVVVYDGEIAFVKNTYVTQPAECTAIEKDK